MKKDEEGGDRGETIQEQSPRNTLVSCKFERKCCKCKSRTHPNQHATGPDEVLFRYLGI
jgi:hypothetical protein